MCAAHRLLCVPPPLIPALAQASKHDRGTTILTVSYLVISSAAPIVYASAVSRQRLTQVVYVTLVFCQLSGFALRRWAMTELGEFFSRTLKTEKDQRIINSGPYAKLRHPGYTANFLVYASHAIICTGSLWALLPCCLLFAAVYIPRTSQEEKMMLASFGEKYEDYRKYTNRFIPFVL